MTDTDDTITDADRALAERLRLECQQQMLERHGPLAAEPQFEEGYDAFERGNEFDSNPYPIDLDNPFADASKPWRAWDDGWLAAEADDEEFWAEDEED
jgi:hypothetical protein